jgi:hypothetical protein
VSGPEINQQSKINNQKFDNWQSEIGNSLCHATILCFSVPSARAVTTLRPRTRRPRPTGWSSASSAVVAASTLIIRKRNETLSIADCQLPIQETGVHTIDNQKSTIDND